MLQYRKQGLRFLIAVSFAAWVLPSTAASPAQHYVGLWQVDRIRQPHKLSYYPRHCSADNDLREITAVDDNRIAIHGERSRQEYELVTDNGQRYFQSPRRSPVLWQIAGDTFLHGVGVFWDAYRRCEAPASRDRTSKGENEPDT